MSTSASTQRELDQDEPFAERVERLANELRRAIRYDRPSILLAVYRSHYVLLDAQAALVQLLAPLDQQIAHVTIVEPSEADLPLRLIAHPDRARTIFFVRGLRNGGADALRALNIRRELLVEHRIRVVFWLGEQEAIDLAHQAPDFWAFRHRVVEFLDPTNPRRAALSVRQQNAHDQENYGWAEDIAARINLREMLLGELVENDETASPRAELHKSLGDLERRRYSYDAARAHYAAALPLYQALPDRLGEANTRRSLGDLARMEDQYEAARAHYAAALPLFQALPSRLGEANTLHSLGDLAMREDQYKAARAHYAAALPLFQALPSRLGEADTRQSLGYLALAEADYEAARAHYAAALPLYQVLPSRIGIINTMIGLGNLERRTANLAQAADCYRTALEMAEQIGLGGHPSIQGLRGTYEALLARSTTG